MGTTWVGHIAHQILVRGGYFNISKNLMEDLPYPEFAGDIFQMPLEEHGYWTKPLWGREKIGSKGVQLNDPVKNPVVIRSHLSYAALKGLNATEKDDNRLACVFRDPADTFLSAYRFIPSIVHIRYELIPLNSFLWFVKTVGLLEAQFIAFADYWQRRHDPNVLVLFFDDMKEDLAGEVKRLADFIQTVPPLTVAELGKVVQQSTHKYMTSPEVAPRFNEMNPAQKMRFAEKLGLANDDSFSEMKIPLSRPDGGKSGEGRHMVQVQEVMRALWDRLVLPRTNCTSVEDMRLKFKAERGTK